MRRIVIVLIVLLVVLAESSAQAFLVNPKKNEIQRRNALRGVAANAIRTGRAPIPAVQKKAIQAWDTNGDGWIDRNEAQKIESYLNDLDRREPV